MGLFSRKPKNGSASGGGRIDLRNVLDSEDMRILVNDFTVAVQQGSNASVMNRVKRDVEGSGVISASDLDVCIEAVQKGVGVFAFFNMMPAGHSALLEKLKGLKG